MQLGHSSHLLGSVFSLSPREDRPLPEVKRGDLYVLIIGDSAAAGTGEPPYYDEELFGERCFRSPSAAGVQIARSMGLKWLSMACSGAGLNDDWVDQFEAAEIALNVYGKPRAIIKFQTELQDLVIPLDV